MDNSKNLTSQNLKDDLIDHRPGTRKFIALYETLLDMSVVIKTKRLNRQWSETQLAHHAGVALADVQDIENGDPINVESLDRIGDALDLKLKLSLTPYDK